MCKVISVSNIKGGVGKSSICQILGAGLHNKGYSVIMIDCDSQANLSSAFIGEPNDDVLTLYDLYNKGYSIDDIKIELKEGLDLVAGDFELCAADMEFFKRAGSLKILSKAITKIEKKPSFIILDTPPSLGFLTLNAYFASDFVLAPIYCDSFSLKAIRLLKQALNDVEEDGHKLPVLGLIINKYNQRTNISKALETNINTAAELLNTTPFNSKIRNATSIMESQLLKKDIFSHAGKNASILKDCNDFIEEFLERVK